MKLADWLDRPGGHLAWLKPSLVFDENTVVGDIRPDLVIRSPDGVLTVWDLTSRNVQRHVAETILYANLLAQSNQLTRLGETYWLKFP